MVEKIDIAIVVLGLVVLASAVTGAILYEEDRGLTTFNVDWATESEDLDAETVSLGASGGEDTITFDVARRNVTTATFSAVLEVSDGHLAQDDLTVNVTAPDGTTNEETTTLSTGESQTSLEVRVQVATIPTVSTVQARNATEAVDKLAEDHTSTNGTGAWTVVVTVNHGGTAISGSHDIEVTPTVGFYSADVTAASPDVRGL